jgi:hypothetical protein
MKQNKSEVQLRKLCGSRGAITTFQKSVSALNEKSEENNCFDNLLEMMVLVTNFQDKNLKTLTSIKEGLKPKSSEIKEGSKTENSELFDKFGRFYATVKICGRDIYKADKHKSFVSNQAKIKKLKIVGRIIHYSPTKTTIYLASEFNRSPLSLAHMKDLKEKKNLGDFHNRMIADIIFETKKFIKENSREICKPLFQKM